MITTSSHPKLSDEDDEIQEASIDNNRPQARESDKKKPPNQNLTNQCAKSTKN